MYKTGGHEDRIRSFLVKLERSEHTVDAILGVDPIEPVSERVYPVDFRLLKFFRAEKGLVEGVVT